MGDLDFNEQRLSPGLRLSLHRDETDELDVYMQLATSRNAAPQNQSPQAELCFVTPAGTTSFLLPFKQLRRLAKFIMATTKEYQSDYEEL